MNPWEIQGRGGTSYRSFAILRYNLLTETKLAHVPYECENYLWHLHTLHIDINIDYYRWKINALSLCFPSIFHMWTVQSRHLLLLLLICWRSKNHSFCNTVCVCVRACVRMYVWVCAVLYLSPPSIFLSVYLSFNLSSIYLYLNNIWYHFVHKTTCIKIVSLVI